MILAGALFAGNALARVGETPEQATDRYGPARESYAGPYSNTMTRVYSKDGIRVVATFIMSTPDEKSVIGEIKYSLPKEMSQSNTVAKAVLLQLLEANAAGQHWEMRANRPDTQDYRRPGATATVALMSLTVTLDEYAAFAAVTKNRRVTEQSDRINKDLKDF